MAKHNWAAAGFVSHLECSATGVRYPHDRLRGLSDSGAPLLVRYDLDALGSSLKKPELAARPGGMWRYREFLPLPPGVKPVSLGESATPLVALAGTGEVLIKDEGRLPTGSFKARGLALAVTMAKHFGCATLAVPTAGNAGAAAAAYGARAGLPVYVFTPVDTPEVTVREIAFHGAHTFRVSGLINDCAKLIRNGTPTVGWHDLSTLAEPYRLEGKKTMGIELAEQLGWRLPDIIYYPTGGGTGFIGLWKAFGELAELGWVKCALPRMVAVQADGCCPVKRAFDNGEDDIVEAWQPVETIIPGVRVPKPLGGRLIMQVIYQSGGFATSVSDEAAQAERARTAAGEGVHLCIEGAACLAAYRDDVRAGRVSAADRAVIFNTANGLKNPMPGSDRRLDVDEVIDYGAL